MRRSLLLVPVLAVACGSPLTTRGLEPSFARAFSGLYTLQQSDDGRTGVDAAGLNASATCRRTGPDATGPGEDWQCSVTYVDGGASFTQFFEVQVKADGCWKAEAPPTTQPAVRAHPITGTARVNPLAEFDGCLDTSWH